MFRSFFADFILSASPIDTIKCPRFKYERASDFGSLYAAPDYGVKKQELLIYLVPYRWLKHVEGNHYKVPHPSYPDSCKEVIDVLVDEKNIIKQEGEKLKMDPSRDSKVGVYLRFLNGVPDKKWTLLPVD